MRIASPRWSRKSVNESFALQKGPVLLPVLGCRVRDDRLRGVAASSTPDSSKVSRTAAQTSARAVASRSRGRPLSGGGTDPSDRVVGSRGSTPPPGKAHIPPANAMAVCRRSR